MYALFVVLNEPEMIYDVLEQFKLMDIRGATVIDSMGTKSLAKGVYNMPIIGGFMRSVDGDIHYNKTIFSVIEREEQVEKVMNHIEKVLGGDMKKPDKGIMFVLPVESIRGGELSRHIESRDNKKVIWKELENEYY